MSGRYTLGPLLILLGAGFLIDHYGIWKWPAPLWKWWPATIILVALIQLLTRSASRVAALLLLVAGGLLQFRAVQLLPPQVAEVFWPAVMILAGVWLIFYRP